MIPYFLKKILAGDINSLNLLVRTVFAIHPVAAILIVLRYFRTFIDFFVLTSRSEDVELSCYSGHCVKKKWFRIHVNSHFCDGVFLTMLKVKKYKKG